ncbi:MAG: radical SAM family heme chaperone HemW [Clostridia bacterium]|nr:radical SAM family heme chaperone HemW [Clostridia bacterium]
MDKIGLYIHVPFCVSKCPYCDFYSLPLQDETRLDTYTTALMRCMEDWAEKGDWQADTLYFGGGTPSLLGGRRLERLIGHADALFGLLAAPRPEITLEANPADDLADTLAAFAGAGGNRLSLGMQSVCQEELSGLGRRHVSADVARTIADAHRAGLDNVSVDMMLGISGQTQKSVIATARQAADWGATHVSAYLLKIEPHTLYGKCPPPLPDDDIAATLYLTAMETLERLGYRQYEISNLARPGQESRHNLKYWNGQPYLGLGPAASSFLQGRRFSYPRDLTGFLAGSQPVEETDTDMPAGSAEEYALLRLRLTEGLQETAFCARFGKPLPAAWRQRAAALPAHLVQVDEQGIRFTREGFLLSNALLTHILHK